MKTAGIRLLNLLGLRTNHPQWLGVTLIALSGLLGVVTCAFTDKFYGLLFPFFALAIWLVIVDFRHLYWLLLASIPVSTQIDLPGFSTDLFSEPLMLALTGIGLLWLFRYPHLINGGFLRHPVSRLVLIHIGWTMFTGVFAEHFTVSLKFFLAKMWFITTFFFWTSWFLKKQADFKKMVTWFAIPLTLATCIIIYRHSLIGFSFEGVYSVLSPFFSNHVMYACTLAVFLPFLWFATYWYPRWSLSWWALVVSIIVSIAGINFAYTRAAYGALVAAVGIHYIIRWKLVRTALIATGLILGIFVSFVTYRDNWLLFAPDYERTITHQRFENLLTATTRLEDISVMERVYRWVAASQMLKERPILGFGPGNFYFTYKDYTISSFRTYVSNNPEKSGMHNYYLMTAVEQGYPGALIFIALCIFSIIYGQKVYHKLTETWKKQALMASLLSFTLIVMLMLMNDFVETDKIGSFFFMYLAVLVNMDK